MKEHKYLEIYPSEVAARKIDRHLDKMLKDKPRVYRKTLVRYEQLAQLLLKCVNKIVRMLQSEMLLSSEDTEFQELASTFDTEQIEELRDSVDALGNLVEKKPSPESKKLAGDTLKVYKNTFRQMAQQDFRYVEVNECAQLMDYWMYHRFSGDNPNFKFQIKQLPTWATYIVIAYGKAHSLGKSAQFVYDFKSWCNSLDDDASNCWALPSNVFDMIRTVDPNNFTVDAMVIYDVLMNEGLYPLVDQKIPMDSSYIAKLIKEYHPDQAKLVRTRITRQHELIESLCLRPTSDVAEVEGA